MNHDDTDRTIFALDAAATAFTTSRMLELALAGPTRLDDVAYYMLCDGGGDVYVVIAFAPDGIVRITTPDRKRGAAFVDALARWLGTPLADLHCATSDPADPIVGTYADLGAYRSTGVEWTVYRLTIGSADVFLRLAPDAGRATLVEKSPRHRTSLLRIATRALGESRFPARRRIVVTQDRRARFTVPPTWRISTTATGATRADDPDRGFIAVYTYPFARRARGLPSLVDRMRALFADRDIASLDITTADRGDLDLVYAADPSPTPGIRGRWVLAANDRLQVVATYYYRAENTCRSLAEWFRFISSLDLASG